LPHDPPRSLAPPGSGSRSQLAPPPQQQACKYAYARGLSQGGANNAGSPGRCRNVGLPLKRAGRLLLILTVDGYLF
jgi:hypothetical protein